MTCTDLAAHLSSWVDGELPEEMAPALEAHLAACASCRERARALRALKHAVARLSSRELPPGAVQARIDALRFEPRPSPGIGPTLLAAALVALVLAAALYATRRRAPDHGLPSDHLSADQLAADHLRSITEPVEIASSNPDEIARFFARRVRFQPLVPHLTGSALKGGRLCVLAGRRSELLFYDIEGDIVSLFVGDRGLAAPGCEASRGLQVCGRQVGDVSLMLVGRQPPDRLARLLAEAQ